MMTTPSNFQFTSLSNFQFTTLSSCGITGQSFYSQIQLHKFDTNSHNGYSIYMPSFNQFLPVVYPEGVTDL